MIEQLIAEATECDFKVALETKKPKSWLKSVSAFSNGIGGTLFFGVSDDREPIGLSDVQKDAEAISRLIKERITPLPQFILKPLQEDGKNLLALEVSPGRSTPYYYKADGVMEAYIRVGNESVIAPDYIVNELILKGTNQSFDTLTTEAVKKDYSFTLLEATYLERTGLRFEPSDYVSFGLADKNGVLTNAGKLMTDQHTVYNSRMFCTRWNGLEKGSIFDDALDDKEYEGNLIYLLKSGSEFIRNNSKVRFVKEAQYRVDNHIHDLSSSPSGNLWRIVLGINMASQFPNTLYINRIFLFAHFSTGCNAQCSFKSIPQAIFTVAFNSSISDFRLCNFPICRSYLLKICKYLQQRRYIIELLHDFHVFSAIFQYCSFQSTSVPQQP